MAEKANEIVAIPDLLAMLELKGAVVTMDAMGCQRAIARQIAEAGADYVLAPKGNHPTLCEDVRLWLDTEATKDALTAHETVEKGHGRIEIWRYVLGDSLGWLGQKAGWPGLSALGRVESTRIIGEKTTTEHRYYLCSFTGLGRFVDAVRNHWGIENGQHWVLDVQFGEDASRAGKGRSVENLAAVRRMSLNVIRHNDPASKISVRRRKRLASLNDDYRSQLIFGEQST